MNDNAAGTRDRPGAVSRLLRPRVVFPAFAITILLVILGSPVESGTWDDSRASTFFTGPAGAQGFYDLVQRLGWQVSRDLAGGFGGARTGSVYVILAPRDAPTAREAHILLDRVRRGARVVWVMQRESAIADSLGVTSTFATAPIADPKARDCPLKKNVRKGFDTVLSGHFFYHMAMRSVLPANVHPDKTLTLASANGAHQAAVLGLRVGLGRVAVVADADFFRNALVRECDTGAAVFAIRALEYASEGNRTFRVVFDEFHQGMGAKPRLMQIVASGLVHTPLGHASLQLLAAAIILLLAVSPRPIPPQARAAIERRSPFEHVEALSLTYQRVGATRTASQRLLRGVRRRMGHGRSGAQALADSDFLAAVEIGHTSLAADIQRVRNALEQRVGTEEFVATGSSLNKIERTIKA